MLNSIVIIGTLIPGSINAYPSKKGVPTCTFSLSVVDESKGKPVEEEFHVVCWYKDAEKSQKFLDHQLVMVKGRAEWAPDGIKIVADTVSAISVPAAAVLKMEAGQNYQPSVQTVDNTASAKNSPFDPKLSAGAVTGGYAESPKQLGPLGGIKPSLPKSKWMPQTPKTTPEEGMDVYKGPGEQPLGSPNLDEGEDPF